MRTLGLAAALALGVLAMSTAVSASPPPSGHFSAHLSGDAEVPTRDTPAQGQVLFKVSRDGGSINYKLIVANIDNVVAAHIHCAAEGVNGPVGVTLYAGGMAGSGRTQGVLARGSISEPDAGNSCGWVTAEDVIEAFLSGGAYVNVHTNDGVDPANTGPGDFPGGEIRGQIGENGAS